MGSSPEGQLHKPHPVFDQQASAPATAAANAAVTALPTGTWHLACYLHVKHGRADPLLQDCLLCVTRACSALESLPPSSCRHRSYLGLSLSCCPVSNKAPLHAMLA